MQEALTLKTMVKTGPSKNPPRIGIYGPQKIGKSTFASEAPKPIFLATEQGLANLDVPHVVCPDYLTFDIALKSLASQEHDFRTVVIDTVDRLEQLIWKHVCLEQGKKSMEHIGEYARGYKMTVPYWVNMLESLDVLVTHRRMAVIAICHPLVRPFHAPDSEPYDRYQLALYDKAGALLRDWLDVLLFANYRTIVTDKESGKGKIAHGTGERFLYTEERPAFWAGNRYSLPFELPFPKHGAWAAFIGALKDGKNKANSGEPTENVQPPGPADDSAISGANGDKPELSEPAMEPGAGAKKGKTIRKAVQDTDTAAGGEGVAGQSEQGGDVEFTNSEAASSGARTAVSV